MLQGIDHFAMGVRDLEEQVRHLTASQGWQLLRWGTQYSTGDRIALLVDPVTGLKLELIENRSERPQLIHVAYRSDDVVADHERLVSMGYRSLVKPHDLKAARSVSALLEDPAGLKVQLICYAPDSPDR
ncbi:MAG: VOC family protein [Armatimonadota bacterium]|nr:VOC family protein [Armatimonadota bacterium]MDR7489516.1 VOC family protein [Armatimonadota bacterium]MDR7529065.1 VOC family protein [Armatimonadota bacterium]